MKRPGDYRRTFTRRIAAAQLAGERIRLTRELRAQGVPPREVALIVRETHPAA